MSAHDDAALADGLRAREEGAVGRFVERMWGPGHRVALAVTGDAALAEDVVQEAAVAAVASVHRWRPERARLDVWALGVVRRHALATRRATQRRARHEAAAAPPGAPADPARAAQRDDELERLRRELAALPVPQREALTLRYVEGLSLAEVGGVVGCPEGTVSSRVRLGLEALRRAWTRPAAGALVPLEELLRRAAPEAPPPPAASAVLRGAAALARRARWLASAALCATAAAVLTVAAVVVAAPAPGADGGRGAPPAAQVADASTATVLPGARAPEAEEQATLAPTPTPTPDDVRPRPLAAPDPAPVAAAPTAGGPCLRVVDGAGRPVAGAQVFALGGHEHPRPVDLGDPFERPRVTGPDGLVPVALGAAGFLVRRGSTARGSTPPTRGRAGPPTSACSRRTSHGRG